MPEGTGNDAGTIDDLQVTEQVVETLGPWEIGEVQCQKRTGNFIRFHHGR